LVEELRSGPAAVSGPKPPAAATVSRQTSVVRSLPSPPEPPQKPLSDPSDSETKPITVPLEIGQEKAFWSELVSRLPVRDMLRESAAKVENAATIGPNHLEILFPSSYHVCKGLCEKPDGLQRLEKLAEELAGRPVRITCRLDSPPADGVMKQPKPVVPKGPDNDRPVPAETNDPYAEKARQIFGAKIVRVEPVLAPKPDPEAVEE
jgi:hypothetical protein